jgi:hypothetical protein
MVLRKIIFIFYGVHKIIVNEKHFPFDLKFIFNFQKIVYDFQNRKPFFDFEHLILKLTYPTKTRLGLEQDSPGALSEPSRELSGTHLRLDRDSPRTCLGPA